MSGFFVARMRSGDIINHSMQACESAPEAVALASTLSKQLGARHVAIGIFFDTANPPHRWHAPGEDAPELGEERTIEQAFLEHDVDWWTPFELHNAETDETAFVVMVPITDREGEELIGHEFEKFPTNDIAAAYVLRCTGERE